MISEHTEMFQIFKTTIKKSIHWLFFLANTGNNPVCKIGVCINLKLMTLSAYSKYSWIFKWKIMQYISCTYNKSTREGNILSLNEMIRHRSNLTKWMHIVISLNHQPPTTIHTYMHTHTYTHIIHSCTPSYTLNWE